MAEVFEQTRARLARPRRSRRRRAAVAALGSALAALGAGAAGTPALAGVATPARWETAQPADQRTDAFLDSTDFDIAMGSNGLATILFWQRPNVTPAPPISGDPYVTRRAADAAAWSAPVAVPHVASALTVTNTELEANSAGTAVGTFFFARPAGLSNIFGAPLGAGGAPPATTGLFVSGSVMPHIAVDESGAAYVVAQGTGAATVSPILLSTYSPGTGAWGAPPTTVTAPGTAADVAVNARGDLAIGFVREVAGNDAVFVMRRLAGQAAFGGPFQVSHVTEAQDVNQFDLAVAPDGTIWIVFAADPARPAGVAGVTNHRIFAVRWLPAGPEGAQPLAADLTTPISDPAVQAPTAMRPRVVVDPQSRVTAAWNQLSNPLGPVGQVDELLFSAERPGATFGAPVQVSPAGAHAPLFDVAVDGGGTAYIVHTSDGRVFGAHRPTGRAFTSMQIDSTAAGTGVASTSVAPKVAAASPACAAFLQNVGAATPRLQLFATCFVPAALPPPVPPPPPPPEPRDCPSAYNRFEGGEGNDTLVGTAGNDALLGRAGNDTLSGLQAGDCLRGEQGDDTLDGGDAEDDLDGGEGNDSLHGSAGNDLLVGGFGADVLFGSAGADRLVGSAGDDRLSSGEDNDIADGGPGNDRIFLAAGNDVARGGEDDDLISGAAGNDRLFGQEGDDRISTGFGTNRASGGDGDDRLRGGPGRDRLLGGNGRDRLFGLGGPDLLIAGDGDDLISGGAGNDRVYGRAGNDRLRGGSGRDLIKGNEDDDLLSGGDGRDRLLGGAGDDRILAVDGERDTIRCGRGIDTVFADRRDRIESICERVFFRRPRPSG